MVLRGALTSLGVTLAIGVVAAFLIARFRDPLENIFQSAGQAVGGFVSKPIAGFIQGFSAIAGDLPDIDISLPSINIKQGTLNFTGTDDTSSLAGKTVPFGGGTVSIPEGCKVNPDGTVSCPTPPIFNPPDPQPSFIPEASGAGLTIRDPTFKLPIVTTAGTLKITSIQDIVAQNPNAIGLFDLLKSKTVEFLPLSVEAVKFFQESGQDLRLSGQLFEEFKTIGDVV